MKGKIELKVSPDDADVGYLSLPAHPGSKHGVVHRTVSLGELLREYRGPDINLDFDVNGELIGIEVLA